MNAINVSTKLATKKLQPIPAPTAIGAAMKKALKTEKAVVGHTDADVMKKLADAITAADTLVGACREAAKLAAKQFNKAAKPAENVKSIVTMYTQAGAFLDKSGKDNANVKAVFSDALWLLAANSVPVTVVKSGKEVHTTSGKAIDLPKHDLRAAASQVRAAVSDKSRAKGGGRKPGGKVASPSRPTAASKAVDQSASVPVVVDAETVFLENLAAYMTDVAMLTRIKATLTEAGWRISKAPAKK